MCGTGQPVSTEIRVGAGSSGQSGKRLTGGEQPVGPKVDVGGLGGKSVRYGAPGGTGVGVEVGTAGRSLKKKQCGVRNSRWY